MNYTAFTYPAASTSAATPSTSELLEEFRQKKPLPPSDDPAALLEYVLGANSFLELASTSSYVSSSLNEPPPAFPETPLLSHFTSPDCSVCKSNSAISFSGGGSRAFTLAAGQTRALLDLGLLQTTKYMAGISGGNWYVNSYVYRDPSLSAEEVLGEVTDPSEITRANLNRMSPEDMRSFVGTRFMLDWVNTFLSGVTAVNSVISSVYDTYLKPNGIKLGAPYAYTEKEAAETIENNPGADWKLSDFNLVADPIFDPFPIIGICLLAPLAATPTTVSRPWILLESSPIATGVAHATVIDYASRDGSVSSIEVGGFVQSSFFSSTPLARSAAKYGLVTVEADSNRDGKLWAVENSAAASSLFPEGIISLLPQKINDYLGFKVSYFSPEKPGAIEDTTMLVGDGGVYEDVTLVPFLQRGVDSVVLFCNLHQPLSPSSRYDPAARLPTWSDIDASISSYFGVPNIPDSPFDVLEWLSETVYRNKVFRVRDYAKVVTELQASAERGNGAVAQFELETVRNDWWGIKGGDKVLVTFVLLSRAYGFEDALDADLRGMVCEDEKDPQLLKAEGPFKDFPHYSTGAAGINKERANLLANQAGWIVKKNKELFRKALGYNRGGAV
jgi:hypothetical protein